MNLHITKETGTIMNKPQITTNKTSMEFQWGKLDTIRIGKGGYLIKLHDPVKNSN